jgi:peptidoglycan glycosyltransferase
VAAIANGGLLREPRITQPARVEADLSTSAKATVDPPQRQREGGQVGPSAPQRLLSPDAAKLLANSLRDAVVAGTGRNVSANPSRIAGKTGTAEVANAPSHAWFVGFAPHGPAKKRIAFAVLFENAGYGGAIAAPAAGEIVSAAAARGLVE